MALLGLLASLLWGAADFLGGSRSRRLPVVAVVLVSQACALAVLLVLVVATGARLPTRELALGAGAGACSGLALVAFYRGLALGRMGVVAPLAATGVLLPVGYGFFLGESPSTLTALGMAIAVVGVLLSAGLDLRTRGQGLPVLLAFVAAAGFGGVVVLITIAVDRPGSSLLATLLSLRLVSVVGMAVVAASTRTTVLVPRRELVGLAGVGLLDLAATALIGVATQEGATKVVLAVLSSLYPAVTAVLARVVHEERLTRVQVAGAVSVLAGVCLIAAGGAG